MVKHHSVEYEFLRLDSSWGLRIFLCPTLVTRRKTSFSYFLTELKIHLLSYAIYLELVGGSSLTGSRKQLFVSGMLFEEQNLKAHRLVWPLILVFAVRLYKQSSVVTNQLLFVMEFQQN